MHGLGSGILHELQITGNGETTRFCVHVQMLSGSLTLRTLSIDGQVYDFDGLDSSGTGKVRLDPTRARIACKQL